MEFYLRLRSFGIYVAILCNFKVQRNKILTNCLKYRKSIYPAMKKQNASETIQTVNARTETSNSLMTEHETQTDVGYFKKNALINLNF